MILDAGEREQLARRAKAAFAARPVDWNEALPPLKQAAALGDEWSMCMLGWCHEFGEGVERAPEQALELYVQAAERGYAPAQCTLGALDVVGAPGCPPDPARGAAWLTKAAGQGMKRAQYLLGSLFERGRGVEQDMKKAAGCFTDAARQGYAPAQFSLGVCYERGLGVEKDYAAALHQYLQAAAQGHISAVYNAGYFYEMGLGTPQDEKRRWPITPAPPRRATPMGSAALPGATIPAWACPVTPSARWSGIKRRWSSSICGPCTTLHGVTEWGSRARTARTGRSVRLNCSAARRREAM